MAEDNKDDFSDLHASAVEFKIRRTASWFAGVVASITAAMAVGSFTFLFSDKSTQESRLALTQSELRSEIQSTVKSSLSEIENLKRQLNTLSNPPTAGAISIKIEDITQRISGLEKKMSTIETAIVDSPERAMSIPILRRDLDSLRTDVRSDLAGTKQEIDRVYDMSKWFIGLMATMAVGILGLAFGNLFKAK